MSTQHVSISACGLFPPASPGNVHEGADSASWLQFWTTLRAIFPALIDHTTCRDSSIVTRGKPTTSSEAGDMRSAITEPWKVFTRLAKVLPMHYSPASELALHRRL
jgi:hypothetical protein